jgi:hypothetical protein
MIARGLVIAVSFAALAGSPGRAHALGNWFAKQKQQAANSTKPNPGRQAQMQREADERAKRTRKPQDDSKVRGVRAAPRASTAGMHQPSYSTHVEEIHTPALTVAEKLGGSRGRTGMFSVLKWKLVGRRTVASGPSFTFRQPTTREWRPIFARLAY